jgi:2-polyprenyl-3-methyl-5-hydroxy-6-metoxy-1,4-benzoquinol methylase
VTSRIYADGTYLARNPSWHVEDSAWKADQCAALLSDLQLTPASICDVGCGGGGVLAALGQRYPGAALAGFDPSVDAIALARQRHPGINFTVGDVESRYELALVMDVIEHVEDCFGLVRSLRPHADLALFHIPLELTCLSLMRNVLLAHRVAMGHIHYFTKDTALALLEDAGYKVVAHRYTPAVVDLAAKDVRSRIVTALQRAGFRLAPDRSVLMVGGYALLVAARPAA